LAKVYVEHDLCISCGLCAEICPEVFHMVDDKAEVIEGADCTQDCCQEAAESCPTEAIKIE